jgi:hypothetical protein
VAPLAGCHASGEASPVVAADARALTPAHTACLESVRECGDPSHRVRSFRGAPRPGKADHAGIPRATGVAGTVHAAADRQICTFDSLP